MTEREREQLLKKALGGLLVVVIGWLWVWPMIDGFLWGKIRERTAEAEKLDTDLIKAEGLKRRAQIDTVLTNRWKTLSLPPDPVDAQRLYKQWVTDLVTDLGFEGPVVKPGQRIPHREIYTTVGVDIEAEATFDTVVRFLFHAQRTNLMHRIAKLDLVSTGTSPSDPLRVTMTAEGFSFATATPRSGLLPRTELAERLDADDDVLVVTDVKGFPTKPGFEVRLGGEFARVTEIDGTTWTVERGLHRTRAASLGSGSFVELFGVSDDWRDVTLADYEDFLARNPFAKPRLYEPRVSPTSDRSLNYGETVRFRVTASGYDTSKGEPTIELVHGKDVGMTFDPESGEFEWTPTAESVAGEYDGMIRVTFADGSDPVERWFTITLRAVNEPPVVAEVETREVMQGESTSFVATATDPEETALTFGLIDAPRDARIDPETGEFTWTVPEDYEPGLIEFDVTARDAGGVQTKRAVQIDILESGQRHTYLVGAYERDGDRWAWLYNERDRKKTELREGTRAMIGGADAFVLVVGRDFMLFVRDDKTYRLDLGRSLAELQEQ